MKTQDFAIVGGVAIVAVVLSVLLCSLFLAPPKYVKNIEKVDTISAEFITPSTTYFNAQSINPTQNITVSPGANEQPFTSSAQ